MANVAITTRALDPLHEVQNAFCLIALGGEVRIADRREIAQTLVGGRDEDVGMYKITPGQLLIRRFLEALPVDSDPKKVIAEFLVSANTKVFNAIAFDPRPTPPTTLNYWSGSPVAPVQGDWTVIKDFLLTVICDGDVELYEYVIRYIAHMLQKPWEKPGIILALLGGQGTGKGTFGEFVHALWPRTTLTVSNIDHVVGKYNAAIERNFVVWMDEALFAGDRKAMDRLKSFVTEKTVTAEQKNQPRRSIMSFHRFFASSNHKHFAQVDADDRRFVFLKISSARQGDLTYWNEVHAAVSNPSVISAALHDLLSYDLSRFNVRQRPKTATHIDQKLRSLTGFDRYWFNVLRTGDFKPASDGLYPIGMGWQDEVFIDTKSLLGGWKELDRPTRQFGPQQERDVHSALERVCPSAVPSRKLEHGSQKRGFQLPSLPVARAEFEHLMGGAVEWHDLAEVKA